MVGSQNLANGRLTKDPKIAWTNQNRKMLQPIRRGVDRACAVEEPVTMPDVGVDG